jgi:pilus assembly protein CpaB
MMDRRRILTLFGIAWLSAALLTWFLYAKTTAPKEQDRKMVMAADRDLPLGASLKKSDVKPVGYLEGDIPVGAIFTIDQAVGRVALYPLSKNEPLTTSKLSSVGGIEGITATIPAGYRAVSVLISDVSGVSGLIQPGSRVDVLFTRPGTMVEAVTSTILQNIKVLAVGHSIQPNQTVDPKATKMPSATLIVTPQDAQKLELAKNEGKISLSLRNPLDGQNNLDGTPVNTSILDPDAYSRGKRARITPDPKIMAELRAPRVIPPPKKPPEPAPRAVVDVYRGDKHVQEIFHD